MAKKLYEYKLNKVNPFIDQTIHHVEKGDKYIMMGSPEGDLVVGPEGELKAHSVFLKKIKVDKAEFRKIYISSLAVWFGLSKTGIRIFSFIASIIKPNKDFFIIDFDDCMEFTGYKSRKSISDGIKELIENKFIARGRNQYQYFINPTVFFNGDRLTFLQQYHVKNDNDRIENKEANDMPLLE